MSFSRSPLEIQRQRKRRASLAIGSFGLAVVVVLLGWVIYSQLTKVEVDPGTNCPIRMSDLTAYTVILIDATDVLNDTQVAEVRSIVKGEALRLPKRGRLDVLSVTDSTSLVQTHFSRCSIDPGGAGLGLTDNPRLQKMQWEETYWGPLMNLLDSLSDQEPASRTPLMEGIQRLSSRFPFEEAPQLTSRGWKLVIVSDLLQFSEDLSLYDPDSADFEQFSRTGAFHSMRADLEGANVVVHLVHRPKPFEQGLQGRSLADFWNQWFDSCRVRDFRIKRLTG